MYGNYFPGRLLHKGFSYNEVVNFIYGTSGIFGVIANVYASYVFLFILFGVFLEKTKVGDVFIDLSYALVGRLRGGAAKASVVSSGLVGSVVGSGAANIVITGTFTIPLMKRAGYKPHYAAAVEAVSSIGGHLLPPIMGSAAFLVAAFTETDYGWIALISLVPALMYYFSVYMSVHFRSGLDGIHGLSKEELPELLPLLKKDGYLLLPVALLICPARHRALALRRRAVVHHPGDGFGIFSRGHPPAGPAAGSRAPRWPARVEHPQRQARIPGRETP